MLGKMRTLGSRGNPTPTARLSEERLALVHRYMIDAEEAEERERVAAERAAVKAQMAAEKAGREARAVAEAQTRVDEEKARRTRMRPRAEALADILAAERVDLSRPLAKDRRAESSDPEAAALVSEPAAPRPRQGLVEVERFDKAAAKAEMRAAKDAARLLAALEKKESRERRALAKAAARRNGEGSLTRLLGRH